MTLKFTEHVLDSGAVPDDSTKYTLPTNSGIPVELIGVLQASVYLLGSKLGSTGELGRMESPGSKRRYREENYSRKQQLCSNGAHGSLRVTGVGNLPGNRKVALTHKDTLCLLKLSICLNLLTRAI